MVENRLEWGDGLLEAVNRSVERVPAPFRKAALRAVIEGSETVATERGATTVQEEDIVAGVSVSVPKNMAGFCRKALCEQGIGSV